MARMPIDLDALTRVVIILESDLDLMCGQLLSNIVYNLIDFEPYYKRKSIRLQITEIEAKFDDKSKRWAMTKRKAWNSKRASTIKNRPTLRPCQVVVLGGGASTEAFDVELDQEHTWRMEGIKG